jgi:hypothetical protein
MYRPGTVDNKLQSVAAERFSIDGEMLPAEIHNFLQQATSKKLSTPRHFLHDDEAIS